jgi:type IV secretory pathway TrbL component
MAIGKLCQVVNKWVHCEKACKVLDIFGRPNGMQFRLVWFIGVLQFLKPNLQWDNNMVRHCHSVAMEYTNTEAMFGLG